MYNTILYDSLLCYSLYIHIKNFTSKIDKTTWLNIYIFYIYKAFCFINLSLVFKMLFYA